MAQNNMIDSADFNDCRLYHRGSVVGRAAAAHRSDPMARAKSLITLLTDTTSMDAKQAEVEAQSAVYVYAPEMIPKIKLSSRASTACRVLVSVFLSKAFTTTPALASQWLVRHRHGQHRATGQRVAQTDPSPSGQPTPTVTDPTP